MDRNTLSVINDGLRKSVLESVSETRFNVDEKTMKKLAMVLKILS